MAPSTNICVIFYIKDIKKEHQYFFNVSDTFILSFIRKVCGSEVIVLKSTLRKVMT